MGGHWKRLIVKEKAGSDMKFFPLTETLAYEIERGVLTFGRTEVCDGYLFLTGKFENSTINGKYNAVSIG
ncbi:hypothetical protein [Undibacterium sp. TJN19]|uniref:hypothetical protein n=1 Tax=Undibacterium sp. TJN19 TaxID=3413055 RepID=UPI003BF31AF0